MSILIPVQDFCQTLVFSRMGKPHWAFGINETDFKNVLNNFGKGYALLFMDGTIFPDL